MAADQATRRAALEKLLPFQREDFIGIFRAMDGLPVTIRLLDPPLHEFLPNRKEYKEMIESEPARRARHQPGRAARIEALIEGRRSCAKPTRCSAIAAAGSASRIPEIYGMQVRAIMEAACTVAEQGVQRRARDHDPAHRDVGEMKLTFAADARRVADGVIAERACPSKYSVGHDDRGAAGGADRRQDRGARRVLLVRHQRPDPD